MVFKDYKKASDNVKREEIWKHLEKIGVAADHLRKMHTRGL
jgi:hypothetical protein